MSRCERGFTLSELLVAVAIIIALIAVAVPVFLNQRDKAFEAQVKTGVQDISNLIQGSALDGTVERNGSGTKVYVASTEAGDVRVSDGIRWNVSGTTGSFCISAYHERSKTYTAENPLTYDSTAGGVGRHGQACTTNTPVPLPSGPGLIGHGNLPVGALQPDPWCPTTCPPTPPLGPGAPNVLPNSAVDPGLPLTTNHYYDARRTIIAAPNPLGEHALQVTTYNPSQYQGFIVWPRQELRPQKFTVGETWSASMYVKGPADRQIRLGFRWNQAGSSNLLSEANCTARLTGEWQRLTCISTISQKTADKGVLIGVQVTMRMGEGESFLATGWQLERADRPGVFQPTR